MLPTHLSLLLAVPQGLEDLGCEGREEDLVGVTTRDGVVLDDAPVEQGDGGDGEPEDCAQQA